MLGAIVGIVNKSKSVLHCILKVYNDYRLSEAGKYTGRPTKVVFMYNIEMYILSLW